MNYPYHVYTLIGPTGQRMDVNSPNRIAAEVAAAGEWGCSPDEVTSRYRKTVIGPVPVKEHGSPLDKTARQKLRQLIGGAA